MIFDYYRFNVVCVEFNFYLNLKYKRYRKLLFYLELNEVSYLEVRFNFLKLQLIKGGFVSLFLFWKYIRVVWNVEM